MGRGLAVGVCGVVLLAGCSGSFKELSETQGSQTTGGPTGARLTGSVYGGRQAIIGARVYLLAANTTGYGGNGIAASASNASASLLTSASNTTLDVSGGPTSGDYYVTTGANGGFTISGDYSCTSGQQVYLYALGGDSGSGVPNAAAGLMAALGACPQAGNFAAATPYIVINEVSTVAMAYALAGFATDATHVSSSGTALAQTGIANAFATVANLETLSTGVALATTPAGNGTVPQAEINTLGNILAACVNSDGTLVGGVNATSCYKLFANATLDGTVNGAQPLDTATAAINIAHYPGTSVAALFGLASGTPPFAPGLSAAPNDFTIALNFTGGGLNGPMAVAIDGAGNAWIADHGSSAMTELSSSGTVLSGTVGYTGGGILHPFYVAIDASGDAWISTNGNNAVAELSNSGMPLSGTRGYSIGSYLVASGPILIDGGGNVWTGYSNTIAELSNSGTLLSGSGGFKLNATPFFASAVDGSNNVWIPAGDGVLELSSSGTVTSPAYGYTGAGLAFPDAIAIDKSGDVWALNTVQGGPSFAGSDYVTKLSNSGDSLSGATGFLLPLNNATAIAIDGAGNAWIANSGTKALNYSDSSVAEVSNAGVLLSPTPNHYEVTGLGGPNSIAIDGSGNVWTASPGNNSVSVFVGMGAPVVTPIAAGLPATPTADGSSKLGTRP